MATNTPADIPAEHQTPMTTAYSDSSDDSDSAGRVYFGPLQSPEKKFTETLARRRSLNGGVLKTPVRRSARSSLPRGPLMANSRTEAEDSDDANQNQLGNLAEGRVGEERARSPTPELMDEPSSVLAGRIMRAHDNPSPPPSVRGEVDDDDDDDNDTMPMGPQPPLLAELSRAFDFDADMLSDPERKDDHNTPLHFDLIPILPTTLQEPSIFLPNGDIGQDTSHPDLISFESFSTPSRSPHLSAVASLSEIPRSTSLQPTIDELLSQSPPPPPSAPAVIPEIMSDTTSEIDAYLKQTPTASAPDSPSLIPIDLDSSLPQASVISVPEVKKPDHEEGQSTVISGSPTPEPAEDPSLPLPADSSAKHTPGPSPQEPEVLPPKAGGTTDPAPRTPRRSARLSTSPYKTPGQKNMTPRTVPPLENQSEDKKGQEGQEKSMDASVPQEVSIDLEAMEKEKRARRREREKRRKDKKDRPEKILEGRSAGRKHRELGSLSPGSADLLTMLMPSASRDVSPARGPGSGEASTSVSSNEDQEGSSKDESQPTEEPSVAPKLHPEAQAQPISVVSTVLRPPKLQRPHPASQASSSSSPLKLASALDDPNRTPARRIPIAQAIGQGTISPQKANQFASPSKRVAAPKVGLLGSPVFKRFIPDLNDPNRSPAKRLPAKDVGTFGTSVRGLELGGTSSPVRPFPRERSGSAEPRPFEKSRSVDRQQKGKQPMLGEVPSRKPASASGSIPSKASPALFWKPPSDAVSAAGSATADRPPRNPLPFPITRIPEEVESQGKESQSKSDANPALSPAKSNLRQPSAGAGSRIPRIGNKPYSRPTAGNKLPVLAKSTQPLRTGSTVTESSNDSTGSKTSDEPKSASRAERITEASSSPSVLKRKREDEPKPKLSPVVVVRKVVPGGFGSKHVPMSSPLSKSQASAQELKDGTKTSDKGKGKEKQAVPRSAHDVPNVGGDVCADIPQSTNTDLEPVTSPPLGVPPASRPLLDKSVKETDDARSSSPFPEQQDGAKVRTRSRSRRPTQYSDDVFGTSAATRPLQPRRRQLPSRPPATVFSGMSMVALRALTSSNTIKNQRYFIDLETEVVRKPGTRPESPAPKVRTVSQKQQEEKGIGRRERAARRARRSEGGTEDGQSEHGEYSMMEEWNDLEHMLHPNKHRRGPGEEEDYETPEKPEPPMKRVKFGGEAETKVQKRVKWDRGLQKTIYLDDPKPEPKERAEDQIPRGGLAKSAKTLRLDTLGNIPNAEAPLPNLVPEKIIVKKFVYDDDPDVVVEVKAPKAKAKKSKS